MNWFKFYIGDFTRDTGHLSLTERGAYLCLIHHYYATEKPLPNDHTALCRVAGAMTKPERDAVRAAMGFFTPVESGLMHSRIEAELHKAGDVSSTNREIALAREAKRREARNDNDQSTVRAQSVPRNEHEQSTPQTPDTRQEEKTKTARKRAAPAVLVSVDDLVAEGVDRQHAVDWMANRKAKGLPLTPTAWGDTKAEALKAGLTLPQAIKTAAGNAWGGFKASWMEPGGRNVSAPVSEVDAGRVASASTAALLEAQKAHAERSATPEAQAARVAAMARARSINKSTEAIGK